jgi:Carboxypeptidase regulatory-like domain
MDRTTRMALLLSAALALGGCATQIAGRVSLLDEAGKPIPADAAAPEETFVNIIRTDATIGEASYGATVNADGGFAKKDIPPGVYKVEVSRPGFVTAMQEGQVKKFRKLAVDARLVRIPEGQRRSIAESAAEEDKIVNRGDVSIAPPPF